MLKIRKEKIVGLSSKDDIAKIIELLKKKPGILAVSYKKEKLIVEYNLMDINLEKIHLEIVALGYSLPKGFWSNFRRKFIYLTDKNEYDNMTTLDSCKFGGG